MDSLRWDALLEWISNHPLLAGVVIFLIAFGDALLFVGVAIPASPLLFAVGVMVGLGHIDPLYAMLCAAAGAFCGDGLSYLAGRRYGPSLRNRWPFARHPEWLERGDRSFRRHGMKSLVIGRFVGAIRPFIPAIAGMVGMPAPRYVAATAFAALLWALAFVGPGWLFGTSLDLIAAVAGRLALLLALLCLLVVSIWAAVFHLWRWLAPQANDLAARLLAWSHRHPLLGRYSQALVDPNQPESPFLLLLGLGLLFAGWAFFELLLSVGAGHAPSQLDLAIHQAMFSLRHPIADPAMGFLASLGDPMVLAPPVLLVAAWLFWRKRRIAAWHWLAAPAFALLLAWVLGWLIDLPKPPAATAVAGFGFPSQPVMLATAVFGFFSVLIAHELPGRRRVWPYVVAALLVGLVGFSRLYLGAHWLSDVLAGASLGLLWVTALGIAYRRRVLRSFWARPVALLFFTCVLLVGGWHASRSAAVIVAAFDPPIQRLAVAEERWLRADPGLKLPIRRNELRDRDAWPLNVHYAGDPARLRDQLAAAGWQALPEADWRGLLMMLDDEANPDTLPVLPSTHDGHAEVLLLARPGKRQGELWVLRLWPAPYAIDGPASPLWLGTAQTLRFQVGARGLVRWWAALPEDQAALRQLAADAHHWRIGKDDLPLRLRALPRGEAR